MKKEKEKIDLVKTIYQFLDRHKKQTKHFLYDAKIKEDYELLEPGTDVSIKQQEYVMEKIKLCLYVLAFGGILIGALWINEKKMEIVGDNQISREDYGGGSKKIDLTAKQGQESIDVSVVLEEKEYTEEELESLYDTFLQDLRKNMIGNNVSLDLVTYDLSFCEYLEQYPFEIQWMTDDIYIARDGHLLQELLEEEVKTQVEAKISYKDFYRHEIFPVCVYSKAIQKTFGEKLVLEMENLEENTRLEKQFTLPDEYDGKKITWKNQVKHYAFLGVIGIPVLLVLLMFCKDNDLHKLVELRHEQMTYDYPEIVSKLSLYIGAGMTTQRAWTKIAREYESKHQKKRYAYEEMLISVREIENGTPLWQAFEHFGRRCKHTDYMKLATLLQQQIKKGTTNIGRELMAEANWAFEERKRQVRQQGEKAGTKMLAPMMILLFIIMTMILVPAFLNQL